MSDQTPIEEVVPASVSTPSTEMTPVETVPDTLPGGQYLLGSLRFDSVRELMAAATEIATVWAHIVETQKMYQMLEHKDNRNGTTTMSKHVLESGWALLASMLGLSLKEESVVRIQTDLLNGYEGTVLLIRNRDGMILGRGGGICDRSESFWKNQPEFALRSMVVTRASAKAVRTEYGWMAKLAGYDPTPYEEMAYVNDPTGAPRYPKAPAPAGVATVDPVVEDAKQIVRELKSWAAHYAPQLDWKKGKAALQNLFPTIDRANIKMYRAALMLITNTNIDPTAQLVLDIAHMPTIAEIAAYRERENEIVSLEVPTDIHY